MQIRFHRSSFIGCGLGLFLGVLPLMATSCGGTGEAVDPVEMAPLPPESPAIDAYVSSLGIIPSAPSKLTAGPDDMMPQTDGDYSCTQQNYSETKQLDQLVAYAANSETLWPGALLQGSSLATGLFTPIVLPRRPETFSVSLGNLAGSKSATLPMPSLSSFRDALASILAAEVTGATPASIYSEIEQVTSSQQLTLALDGSAAWGGQIAKIAGAFNFSDTTQRSRYLVRYTQNYFTVDLDPPTSPSQFFDASVTLADVERSMGPGNPPAYVSSITYGRMVVFVFESSYSAEELGAALNFAYNGAAAVTGSTSVTYQELLDSTKITAFIIGGSGSDAAMATVSGYSGIRDFISKGGNFSLDSPGAPIAYKLAYLADRSPARLSLSNDYTVRNCTRVNQRVQVTLKNIKVENANGDGSLQIFGTIRAYDKNGIGYDLWNKTSAQYVDIPQGSSFPQTPPLAQFGVDVVPRNGTNLRMSVHLFDYNSVFANTDFGLSNITLRFEDGWRKDIPVSLTAAGYQVTVNLAVQPL